jgi:hypothetical protein
MKTEDIAFGALFGIGGILATYFLFVPRFKKYRRWVGGAPASTPSRILFCLFAFACSAAAFSGGQPALLFALFAVALALTVFQAVDKSKYKKSLRR